MTYLVSDNRAVKFLQYPWVFPIGAFLKGFNKKRPREFDTLRGYVQALSKTYSY
jgi:hypothetical protein